MGNNFLLFFFSFHDILCDIRQQLIKSCHMLSSTREDSSKITDLSLIHI